MKTDDIAHLVNIIEQCKQDDVRKILVDYLATQLYTKGMIPAPLSIDKLNPTSWRSKCRVCNLDGVQGYVCSRNDCPCKITSGIDTY